MTAQTGDDAQAARVRYHRAIYVIYLIYVIYATRAIDAIYAIQGR